MLTSKRKHIAKTAIELIVEYGFKGAPVALIAEKAGVGIGTIYRHFENKDNLILELYKDINDRFKAFILDGYPKGRPVRECFFYIGMMIIKYFKNNPLDFKFSEQFHHSPYFIELIRKKMFDYKGELYFCRELYEIGKKNQVIKDVAIFIFFDLAVAPLMWSIKDHFLGFIDLDDDLTDKIVSSCWDSIRM